MLRLGTYRRNFAETNHARGAGSRIRLILCEYFGDVHAQNSADIDEDYAAHYNIEQHIVVGAH